MTKLDEDFIKCTTFCVIEDVSEEMFLYISELYFEGCKAQGQKPMSKEVCAVKCSELIADFREWELKQSINLN